MPNYTKAWIQKKLATCGLKLTVPDVNSLASCFLLQFSLFLPFPLLLAIASLTRSPLPSAGVGGYCYFCYCSCFCLFYCCCCCCCCCCCGGCGCGCGGYGCGCGCGCCWDKAWLCIRVTCLLSSREDHTQPGMHPPARYLRIARHISLFVCFAYSAICIQMLPVSCLDCWDMLNTLHRIYWSKWARFG